MAKPRDRFDEEAWATETGAVGSQIPIMMMHKRPEILLTIRDSASAYYPERGTFLRSNGRMLSYSLTSVLPEEKLMRNLLASLLLVSGLSLTARAIDYDDKKSLTADEIISKHLEGAGEMFQKGSFE
jgi:hypothetical protein